MAKCVFCERIEHEQYAITYHSRVVRFAPLNPVTPGHMLFVPTIHVPDASEDPFITAAVAAEAARYVADSHDAANIITSIGEAATQTVFHLHVHVVPRRPGDGLALPWTGQQRLEAAHA